MKQNKKSRKEETKEKYHEGKEITYILLDSNSIFECLNVFVSLTALIEILQKSEACAAAAILAIMMCK